MLLVYKYGSFTGDEYYCYDTEDFTLEKVSWKDIENLAKTNQKLFDNVRYIKNKDEVRMTRTFRTVRDNTSFPEILKVNDHTSIWIWRKFSRIIVFCYEMCWSTQYAGDCIDSLIPVVYKDIVYIAPLGNIKEVKTIYYKGDYSPTTLKRALALKGTDVLETIPYVTEMKFGVNLVSGIPYNSLVRFRELW